MKDIMWIYDQPGSQCQSKDQKPCAKLLGLQQPEEVNLKPALTRQWSEASNFVEHFCTLLESKNLWPCENSCYSSKLFL